MSEPASPIEWPQTDPEGRPVRFTSIDPRPRPEEYEPLLTGIAVRLEPLRESRREALCARYMSIDRKNRHMEIGSTWIGRQWQRIRVNTEGKYMMLRHAFEELGCLRIEFKTDSLNERSCAALLRIGAVQERANHCHVITDEGRIRHSVYFSITADEWPGVRLHLEALLQRNVGNVP